MKKIIIAVTALFQTILATYAIEIFNNHFVTTILFFLCSILIGVCSLGNSTPTYQVKLQSKNYYYIVLCSLPYLVASYFLCRKILDGTPIAIEHADMLPVIKAMNTRLINGELNAMYTPIKEIWNGVQPVYLPCMFVPFLLGDWLNFDMRWITISTVWISVFVCMLPVKKVISWSSATIFVGIAILLIWFHFNGMNNVFRLTEEGVVYLYYCLFFVALFYKNPYLIGVSLAFCLLSRYAIIGAIPAMMLYYLVKQRFVYLLKMVSSCSIVVCLFFLFPFGTNAIYQLVKVPEIYIQLASNVWKNNPEFMYKSLGFAKFFGAKGILLQHQILKYGTFIFPLLIIVFILVLEKVKQVKYTGVEVCVSVCSIGFFYSFIDISYLYLYYTPVFVSLVCAAYASMPKKSNFCGFPV